MHILKNDQSDTVKKEAIWALGNCTYDASDEQLDYMVQKGLLKVLTASFCEVQEVEMLKFLIEGFDNILACGKRLSKLDEYTEKFEQALEKLESLLQH